MSRCIGTMTGWGCFLGLANLILDHRIRCNWPESGARNRPPRSHLRDTSTRRPLRVIIDALVFTGIILQALQHGNVLLNSNDAVTVFSQVLSWTSSSCRLHHYFPAFQAKSIGSHVPFRYRRSSQNRSPRVVLDPVQLRNPIFGTLLGLAWALAVRHVVVAFRC